MNREEFLKEILNYVNIKGYSKSSFNSELIVKLYDQYIQEWGEYYLKFIEKCPDKVWTWWEISKNPNISVKNPGIISKRAAKANAAPDIISYIGISFLII